MPSPITRLGLEIQLASQWKLFIYRLKETRWCIGAELRELNMPENTRVVALFRNNQLLHPSGSTVLETNDILCIVGHDYDLPVLGHMFSETPKRGLDLSFFGDFMLDGQARLADLAHFYPIDPSKTTAETIRSEEHTSELQSRPHLVCRLLLEKKKNQSSFSNICSTALLPSRKTHRPRCLRSCFVWLVVSSTEMRWSEARAWCWCVVSQCARMQ